MVYDPQTEEVILFGGYSQSLGVRLNDLWAYDPVKGAWTELAPSGAAPSAREGQTMTYDAVSGKVVLFGGYSGTEYYNDTWAYDPQADAWQELTPAGDLPPARTQQCMVYDSAGAQTLLYGGWDDTNNLTDIWAYDLVADAWHQVEQQGDIPEPRFAAAAAYEPVSGKMYVFGGFPGDPDQTEFLDELWAYDPATNQWTQLEAEGDMPAPRNGHCLVADSSAGTLVLFGGTNSEASLNDLWTYDPASNAWTAIEPADELPQVRVYASMVYDETDEEIIVFSGMYWQAWADLEDTWAYPLSLP